jgi:hypothetical protein
MNKIFGGYIRAHNPGRTVIDTCPALIVVGSRDEAIAVLLERASQKWPAANGWQDHLADVVECTPDQLEVIGE